MPGLMAQNCSNWDNWSVRGTYTVTGNGWIDLARDPSQSKGYSPQVFVQAFTLDGRGGGTGWIQSNLGGIDFQAKVKWTYSVQADCKITGTSSYFVNGAWTAPNTLSWVISSHNADLKLSGIMVGAGPGSGVAQATATRLSMDY